MSEPLLQPTLDELLAAHAAGSLPLPMALAVGTHLALSPPSRRQYRVFEALGGALLEEIAPAALAATRGRSSAPASTGGPGSARRRAPPPRPPPASRPRSWRPGLLLPRPLRDYLPGPVGHLDWRPHHRVHEAGSGSARPASTRR
jgi:putative transcriptional regulator